MAKPYAPLHHTPTLSVVVPVYNVAPLLNRCIESLLSQGIEDYEVILVDDGSTDSSGRLCEEWAKRHAQICVIHQENRGLSEARNTGIRQSRGRLITFVDSDDYLAPTTYAKVLKEMQPDDDFIEFPVQRFCGTANESRLTFPKMVLHDACDYWIRHEGYAHAYAWNKIYKRELFNGVQYPRGILFEDVHIMPMLLRKAHQIRLTDLGLYYYCYNHSGITATATGFHLQSLLHAHADHWNIAADTAYFMHVLNIQLDVCRLTGAAPVLTVPQKLHLRDLPLSMKVKALLLKTLGIKALCRINNLLWKFRHNH